MLRKVREKIIQPFPHLNGRTVEVRMDKSTIGKRLLHPHFWQ